MRIEIELLFNNKKIKDNLIIEFNEDLLKWTIRTENQEELNKILKEKSFLNQKDIINFLQKYKYKFDKNKIKELEKPHVKSFVFNFKEDYMIEGHDGLNTMKIIKLKFKGKNAYFYTSRHDDLYSGFNCFWKEQHKGHDSTIWKEIFNLDKKGYICFNDLYDRIDSEFDSLCSEYEDGTEDEYSNIIDYAKEVLNEEGYLIINFFEQYIYLLNDLENQKRYESDFELNCIIDFYLEYEEFYENEIKIDKENWEILECILGKTESITKYKYDLLSKKLPTKDNKDKKTKI